MEDQHNVNPPISTTQITGISANDLIDIINERIEKGIEKIESKLQAPEPNKLLTREEVAEYFSISLVTLDKWCKKGVLQKYRIGKKVRFKQKEVLEAMAKIEANRNNG